MCRAKEETMAEFKKEVARIQKQTKVYNSANIIELTIGKIESDGDWGHGGRSYIKIADHGSTCAMIRITNSNGEAYLFGVGDWQSVEILAGGETERKTISEAMEDAGKYLKNGVTKI
jgi:hypothetical protein